MTRNINSNDSSNKPRRKYRRTVVLGSHPLNGRSMIRYTRLLHTSYSGTNSQSVCFCPSAILSQRIKSRKLQKFVKYIESLIIFPISLLLRLRADDLIHIADHSDGIWLLAPWVRPGIVTCHDFIAIQAGRGLVPEYKPRLSGRLYQKLIEAGLRKAALLVCVSEATAANAPEIRRAGQKIKVLHNPVESLFQFDCAEPSPYPQPYYLVVSPSGWRKNRPLSLSCAAGLAALHPREARVVVVGDALTSKERHILGRWPQIEVSCLTSATDVDLRTLYKNAEVLVSCSSYEGFGWPVLEANAQGTRSVCLDTDIYHETNPSNLFIRPNFEDTDLVAISQVLPGKLSPAEIAHIRSKYSMEIFVCGLLDLYQAAEGNT